MMVSSSIYAGSVMHRRLHPRRHHFRYRAYWLLLDLEELSHLSNHLKLFSYNGPNLFSFYDSDHGDGTDTPLRAQIDRQLVEAHIDISGGRVTLLCMPRTLGYCFNPLSIFFCHRKDGSLAALVYQVHNTFAERHSYVIAVEGAAKTVHQNCRKGFYVSPFLDMELRYDFRITGPDERVTVAIAATGPEGPMLNAVMTGSRRPLTDRKLAGLFLSIPALTLKVIASIHWEALRLWIKRIGLRQRPSPPVRAATIVPASEVYK
jgi:DUF1365 family protein